jgi:hypothetical protein
VEGVGGGWSRSLGSVIAFDLEGADSLGLLPPFAHLTPAILGPKNTFMLFMFYRPFISPDYLTILSFSSAR